MAEMMIKFVNCGVYKTEEQATNIANALLMSTCFTETEYASVIVAIQKRFNPQIAEEPQVIDQVQEETK